VKWLLEIIVAMLGGEITWQSDDVAGGR